MMSLLGRISRTTRIALIAFGLIFIAVAWPPVARWREGRFVNSLTPREHYIRAILLCRGNQRSPRRCSKGDLKTVIHHLEAIPKDSRNYEDVADMLPLLRIQRDRPQDFDAAERAKFQECKTEVNAEIEKFKAWLKVRQELEAPMRPCPGFIERDGRCVVMRCATWLYRRNCAPFASAQRYAELETPLSDHR